jgi:hypothetical protein
MLAQVDGEGFEAEMAAQRGRSREAVRALDLTAGGNALGDLAGRLAASAFLGYEHGPLRAQAAVLAILKGGEAVERAKTGDEVEVVLDRTPFYAESGGQSGDSGRLTGLPQPEGCFLSSPFSHACAQLAYTAIRRFQFCFLHSHAQLPLLCAGEHCAQACCQCLLCNHHRAPRMCRAAHFVVMRDAAASIPTITVHRAACAGGDDVASTSEVAVRDTQKGGGGSLVVHAGTVEKGELRVGQLVRTGFFILDPLCSLSTSEACCSTRQSNPHLWSDTQHGAQQGVSAEVHACMHAQGLLS